MDLRHLRYFLAVAEEGHFGRAAQRLHIVQPALSMQIRALEEELGAPLFLRTSRRVDLTEAGRLFRIEAERTLAQAERAKSIFQRAARGEIGNVRIGFAGIAAFDGRLSADLRSFHAQYPDVELDLREIAPQLQADGILNGQLDVGYTPAYGFTFDTALVTEPIASWPWLIAMAEDHALAKNDTLESRSLRDEIFILYAAHGLDTGQWVTLRRLLGTEPRISHRVANTLTVLAMAAAGLGIALVPRPLGEVRIPNITYRPLVDGGAPSNLLLLSRAAEPSAAVNTFLHHVRDRNSTTVE